MKSLLIKTVLAGLPLVGILLAAPPAALARHHHHHHCWRGDRYGYNYDRPSYQGNYYYGGSPYNRYGYSAQPYYGNPYAYGSRPYYGGGSPYYGGSPYASPYYGSSPYASPYGLSPGSLLPSLLGLFRPGY